MKTWSPFPPVALAGAGRHQPLGAAVPSRRELVACVAGLGALALAMCLPHIRHGGFYFDDWWVLSLVRSPAHGFTHAVGDLWPYYGQRPGQVAYYALVEPLLGYRSQVQLALAAALLIGEGTLTYALLRRLTLRQRHAAAIAVLIVAFPFDDSVWLWPIMSVSTVAVCASIGGVLLALRALESTGRRAAGLHAASLSLYVAGIFTYELFAVAGCLSGLLYASRVGWRKARLRWAVDVAAIACAVAVCRLLLPQDIATPHAVQSPLGALDHAGQIVVAGARLAGMAVFPFGGTSAWVLVAALVLTHAVAALVARSPRAGDETAALLRRWRRFAWAGALLALCAWAVYIPASDHYTPTAVATTNRINALASAGVVVFDYASIAIVGVLAGHLARGRLRAGASAVASAVAIVGACALGVGYLSRTLDDTRIWNRAATEQRHILASLRTALPRPPANATVYAVDDVAQVESVPVLDTTLDLTGALRLSYGASNLRGVPIRTRTRFACGPTRMYPLGDKFGSTDGAAYGRAFIVYVATKTAIRVSGARQCAASLG